MRKWEYAAIALVRLIFQYQNMILFFFPADGS